jgi:hypothetical protein
MAEFAEIRVASPDHDTHVTITPQGIWLSDKSGKVMATMHFQGKMPVVAVADHRCSKQQGHQLALSVDENGEPALQIAKGDKIVIVGVKKLSEIFGEG